MISGHFRSPQLETQAVSDSGKNPLSCPHNYPPPPPARRLRRRCRRQPHTPTWLWVLAVKWDGGRASGRGKNIMWNQIKLKGK